MNRRFTLVQALLIGFALGSSAQDTAPFPDPPKDVSSTAILANGQEPGKRLSIHGTVYRADSTTPYEHLVIYIYQTDASGVYNQKNRSWREPRLRGWVKTGAGGKYEIQTIKPGSYPGSRNPAHIHAIIKLPGRPPQWIDDYLFDGDPFLTDEQRQQPQREGRFSNVMKLTQASDGRLVATRDIVIED